MMEFPHDRFIYNIRETAGWLSTHSDPCVKALANDNLTLDELCQRMYRALSDAELVPSAKFAFESLYDVTRWT